MRYRMLDLDGDYCFGKGQQNITYGTFAVSQAIKTRMMLLKGEWWENKEEGLPLFQSILGSSSALNNLMLVDNFIKERILKTQDVIQIKKFESRIENRKYYFDCMVETKYGDASVAFTF